MPPLRSCDAVYRQQFPAPGDHTELERVFAILRELRPGTPRESASPGDYPLTWYEQVNPKPSLKRSQELSRSDGGGNHISQRNAAQLPRDEFAIVSPKLELVRLQPRQVLHEAGDTLKSAYFCNTGLISILSVLSDG